ncbi:MAG: hypothetical protein VCC20_05540 [Myxococcota bacterium]
MGPRGGGLDPRRRLDFCLRAGFFFEDERAARGAVFLRLPDRFRAPLLDPLLATLVPPVSRPAAYRRFPPRGPSA